MRRGYGWLPFAVLLILLAGASFAVHERDRADRLLVAAVNHHDSRRVEMLLGQGANPNVRDWKTYYGRPGAPFVPPWYEKPLALLMRRKPRSAGRYVGPTVLMIAAFQGDTQIVQSLLDHGADMSKTGTGLEISVWGMDGTSTPVYEAATGRHAATALLMARRGTAAVNNARGEYGNTPLMAAVQPEVAAALIDHGAEVNAKNEDGWTPLIHDACDADLDRLLLDQGADVNAANKSGETPLIRACMGSRVDAATLLLARGATVNSVTPPAFLRCSLRRKKKIRRC